MAEELVTGQVDTGQADRAERVDRTQLSGNAYVSGWEKGERQRMRDKRKILIAGKRRPCDHESTICAHCMPKWYDYVLTPHSTGGGRRLLAEREKLGLDNSQWPE